MNERDERYATDAEGPDPTPVATARRREEPDAETQDEALSTADMAAVPTAQTEAAQPSVQGEPAQAADEGDEKPTPLFHEEQGGQYRDYWRIIQTRFVDDPHRSVQEADQLVARLMQDLAQTFADERAGLESQWGSGENVSTEDLRLALRRYRSFFDRLLSI
jgi:hypothetical protein